MNSWFWVDTRNPTTNTYQNSCQMERFAKIANNLQLLFLQNVLSWMFYRVLNTPMSWKCILFVTHPYRYSQGKREAIPKGCSVKKVFLEISPNSQENTCTRVSFFNIVEEVSACNFIKEETLTQVFLEKNSGGCF